MLWAEESWEQICSGLVSKGICEVMPVRDLYHIGDTPVLNGMFGVSKDEFDQGVEVMRLIMNLIPVNKLCRNLGGDVATLPNWSGMGSYWTVGKFCLCPLRTSDVSSISLACRSLGSASWGSTS